MFFFASAFSSGVVSETHATTEVAEEGRSLMTSLATIVVNGLGKTLPIWITNLKKKQSTSMFQVRPTMINLSIHLIKYV